MPHKLLKPSFFFKRKRERDAINGGHCEWFNEDGPFFYYFIIISSLFPLILIHSKSVLSPKRKKTQNNRENKYDLVTSYDIIYIHLVMMFAYLRPNTKYKKESANDNLVTI